MRWGGVEEEGKGEEEFGGNSDDGAVPQYCSAALLLPIFLFQLTIPSGGKHTRTGKMSYYCCHSSLPIAAALLTS